MQLEYVTWRPPGLPPVVIRRQAVEGIQQEINEAFAALPHRGLETGGILLGRREQDRIVVEDFEPVPSEHRYGPSYRFSDVDCKLLQETVDWFRGGAQPGLAVLGRYRSHLLREVELSREDEDIMRAYFGSDEDVVLLVKPSLMETSESDFIILRCAAAEPAPPPDPPPLMTWPAPHPRQSMPEPEPEPRTGIRWPWYVAAVVFGLAAGAFGYVWWHPDAGLDRIAVSAASPPAPVAAAMAPAAAPPPVVEAPPPAESDLAGIHQLLERWSAALKRGDVDIAAQCYAPVVNTYFDRHDVPREAVRQSIKQGRARYGHLEIYRISGLGITPVGDTRAVVTFHKHWQWRTSLRARSSGEEDERMTLVRNQGAWRISSEQTR